MHDRTVTALEGLGAALDGVDLRLDLPDVGVSRQVRSELSNQIDDYLLPRLRRIDAPLLAVLGGSTGSGKSTITNSLAGAEVSPSGVLRPTTRAPTLICHPDDLGWFSNADILPDLARVTGESSDGAATGDTLRLAPVTTLIPGLALIDAPDIDSIETANRELATQLLAAADLWVFVTTAVRYADAVPWEFLGRAQSRGTSLAVVINRMPAGAAEEIVPHLGQMLADGGLPDTQLFAIDDADLVDGRLPADAIAELETMLRSLASDASARAEVVRRTIDGALLSVPDRARSIHEASLRQDAVVDDLRSTMERTIESALETITADLSGGALLRGEVLDRWQELIGTNEMMRAVQSRISALRDRLTGFLRGRPEGTREVQGEITSTLEQLIIDHADAAALSVATAWKQMPGGAQVVQSDRSLERASPELRDAVGPEIRAWQDDILELVRERGAGKRNIARVMAFGVNSIGVALMIVLFAQTGGVTGGEVAVASGTAGVSQALLNALFGEQAVRDLANQAREKLAARIGGLVHLDANRFRAALWATASPPAATAALGTAIDDFDSRS